MKYYEWNLEKNEKLKKEREIGFEECITAIEEGNLLDTIDNNHKYPNQRIFVIKINHYAYLIPFIEDEKKVFLKTIVPSRKATKKYILQAKNR